VRAIVTGQVGMDKKPYVEVVGALARERGEQLSIYHVGDRMYAEAPDVRPGTILDLPLGRLHAVRRAVFRDITAESAGLQNVIVNTHATFRWRHGLFRAFDFDQIEKFQPDAFICLVDNIESVYHRLHAEHALDVTLKDLMVWREEEMLATELLALAVGCANRSYIVPRGRRKATTASCFRLVCHPDVRKVYLSFPMTHIAQMPDVVAQVNEFRDLFGKQLSAFDPGDVDEKLLLEAAIAAAREGRDFVEAETVSMDGSVERFCVSVKQVLDIAGDVDGQIYARDFKLIDQSDMILSLIPELAGGVPGLSSGVERELQHAYEHGKDVYVIWLPQRNPSPFITETATQVFRSSSEALHHFRSGGMLAP
jgi:adenylate kinase